MIGVIAELTIDPDKREAFEAAAGDLVAKVNANEDGCVHYDLYRDPKDAARYVFMERYADEAALEAHGKTEYFLAAQGPLGACLTAPPRIRRFDAVA